MTDDDIEDLLRAELRSRGVLPDARTYERVRREITLIGEEERSRVERIAGRGWNRALARLERPRPEEDVARVLGFGHALTGFVVAPLDLSAGERAEVAGLGATANLLVTTYDRIVDLGGDPDAALPRRALELAAAGRRLRLALLGIGSPVERRVLTRIVAHYFDRLGELPGYGSRPAVRRAVERHVWEMYEAERRTLESGGPDEGTLRVVSAYPFVVMGLPGWLATPEVPDGRYGRHLDWLYRVGEFVGRIDDIVDLREDAVDGVYNPVAARRDAVGDDRVVREIADAGRAVVDGWEELTGTADLPEVAREALGTCVVSWFGGLRGR